MRSSTRYDFKNTDSSIELNEKTIELDTESDARLQALTQVLEEKLVKRKVSLKALAYGKIEEASKGTVRQTVTLNVGISTDKAKEIGKFVKELGLKGVSHQIQGDQLRISGKKRDDLQAAIAGAEGARLRGAPAVHELPRLSCRRGRSALSRRSALSGTSAVSITRDDARRVPARAPGSRVRHRGTMCSRSIAHRVDSTWAEPGSEASAHHAGAARCGNVRVDRRRRRGSGRS